MGADRLAPRKTPRQRRATETRDRIVDAGARVFARHGYAKGTTNRIAAEANLSVGSLYQYFPNKDAILVALVWRHVADGAAEVSARLAATSGEDLTLAERLGILIDAVIAVHEPAPRLHRVLFEDAPRPPELVAELHELAARLTAAVERMLRAEPSVRVGDVPMAAGLVAATIESLVHRYISSEPGAPDLPAFRAELVTMLTRYLMPPGPHEAPEAEQRAAPPDPAAEPAAARPRTQQEPESGA